MRQVRRGGRVAVIEGEAGIGKTRLVDVALDAARAADAVVLAAKAQELEAQRSFGPIVDLAVGRWRERLDEQLAGMDIGPERQFGVAETVLDMLDDLCSRAPLVLAIEDLHWSDPATLGVLARVARGIERLPVVLIVSARPQPRRPELERLLAVLDDAGAVVVQLGPLDEDGCAALVAGLVGAQPGTGLVVQAQRAGGNPLFVGELVAALDTDGAIERSNGRADIAAADAMPSLPVTIRHRLSVLPPDALEVLGLAAVLGSVFDGGDLALLARCPVSDLAPAVRTAQNAGVIAEQGERLTFRHELIRDALYEDVPLAVRRGLHAQLAHALAEAGAPADRVAGHLLRGTAPGAASALVDAARELGARAPGVAVDLYRQAIALADDPGARRAELLPELAETLVSAGLLGEGAAACREALTHDLDPGRAGRLRLHLMRLLTRRGRISEAIREGEAGLASPTGGLDRDRIELEGWVAMSRVFDGQIEAGVRAAAAIVAAGADDAAVALATNGLALAADARGAFTEAAELIARNVRWAEATGTRAAYDTRPYMLQPLMLARLDRFDEAEASIRRGRHTSAVHGLAESVPVFHYQLAFVDLLRGRLDDALAELATRSQLAVPAEIGWDLSAHALAALIELHRDDLLAAERNVIEAEREAAASAPPFGADLMMLARARLLEATGGAAAAVGALAGTFDALVATGAATCLPLLGPDLARLAAATGEPERAAGVVPALERVAALNPETKSLRAAVLQARGRLEGTPAALAQAAELLWQSGRVLEAARAAEDTGDRALLERARDAYERSGAVRDLARVEGALRALGVRRSAGGQRPSTGWEALTETELTVVRLVAERLTNPEIAERTFISRRTVQTHVSHALAKLGVGSRRDLAAEAARRAGSRLGVKHGASPADARGTSGTAADGPGIDPDQE